MLTCGQFSHSMYESSHYRAYFCLAMALTWKWGTGYTVRAVSLCRELFRGETAPEQPVGQLLQPSQLHQCALCKPP